MSSSSTSSTTSASAPAERVQRRRRRPRAKKGDAVSDNDTVHRDTTLGPKRGTGKARRQRAMQVVSNITTALSGVTHNNIGHLRRAGTCACIRCKKFFRVGEIKHIALPKQASTAFGEYLQSNGLSAKTSSSTAFCPSCNTASLIPWRRTGTTEAEELAKLRRLLRTVTQGARIEA